MPTGDEPAEAESAKEPTAAVLAGFDMSEFAYAGQRYDVYRTGSGPAVVVLHEIQGLHPGVVAFGRRLAESGFTVYLPSLFGRVGEAVDNRAVRRAIWQVCISREFKLLADRTSRVVTWLRALAAKAHDECGGPGVGAVGMCFTGGFALAMAVEPAVVAPVLSQPSLPVGVTRRRRRAISLDAEDLATLKLRTDDGFCALGLRFSHDRAAPAERFHTLRQELGDRFEYIEIDSAPGNVHGIPETAHSVLTTDLIDEPGHPTRAALDRVLEFLSTQLR